jgi:hypothetical protein
MQITLLGLALVPLSLFWALRPERLLQLALISSIFEAAAALVLGGSFGLQPAMFPGLLFIAFIVSQYGLGMRYPGEGTALLATVPLLALLFYAILSAWLLPDAFAGQILVEPQKRDLLSPDLFVPLQFSFGNVTQTLYLAVNVAFAVAVAIFLTRGSIRYESIIAAYLLGGYIVAALTVWQFASRIAGVPFPDDLLHSNPGWAIVEQSIGSVPRVQGPFSEPAALAGYMSGIAICCLWLSAKGYKTMRPNVLLALAIFCTFLSTSATGIVALVVGLPMTLAIASIGGDPAALARIGKTVAGLLLAGVIAIGPVIVLKPSIVDSISTIVEATVDKQDSQSYEERSSSDAGALATIAPTYGLGVGWGSYRSSSLIPGLLANGGFFAVAMVLWLIVRVFRLGLRGRANSPEHPGQILVNGFTASLCMQFATALIAAPMISSMSFFLQLGCIIGVLARMSLRTDRSVNHGLVAGGERPAWRGSDSDGRAKRWTHQ